MFVMSKSDPESVFVAAVEKDFSFLVAKLGFERCGLLVPERAEPREAERRVRYRSPANTVDLVLSMTRGLGLDVARRAPSADPADCRSVASPFVDFERFLLARHGAELEPPLPGMKPHRVFMTMYSQQPVKYTRVVQPKLGQAVEVMAGRFKRYGPELLSADLELVWRETRGISSQLK